MQCKSPVMVNGKSFNCGRCLACRINYTSMWSLRLLYELSTSDSACFLTLTYNDENLPQDYGLQKKELQNFFKRLRINFQREFHEFAPKIKYYACGEYGEKEKVYLSPGATKRHGRPHYHAIVFGVDNWSDKHRRIVTNSWQKCEPWLFDKDRGRLSAMQEVTPEDIQYVTGYVQKKLSGEPGKEMYGEVTPPFSICSQGLGLEFAMKNKERLIDNGWTVFKGHKISIPRYFCEKFDVKRGELIKSEVPQTDKFLMSQEHLFSLFVEDMKAQKTYYPDNLKMMSHRFQQWLENKNYELSKRLYQDFLQKQKLRGFNL